MKVLNIKRKTFIVKGRSVGKTEVMSVDDMKQLQFPFMSNCISGAINVVAIGKLEPYNEKPKNLEKIYTLDYESIKNMTNKLNAEMDEIAKQELLVDEEIKKIVDKSS